MATGGSGWRPWPSVFRAPIPRAEIIRRRCGAPQLWRKPLLAALPQMELTLLVGSYAQAWHLGRTGLKMTETVRHWRAHIPAFLPLPHPSWRNTGWLKRNPWFEEEIVPYLRQRVQEILRR